MPTVRVAFPAQLQVLAEVVKPRGCFATSFVPASAHPSRSVSSCSQTVTIYVPVAILQIFLPLPRHSSKLSRRGAGGWGAMGTRHTDTAIPPHLPASCDGGGPKRKLRNRTVSVYCNAGEFERPKTLVEEESNQRRERANAARAPRNLTMLECRFDKTTHHHPCHAALADMQCALCRVVQASTEARTQRPNLNWMLRAARAWVRWQLWCAGASIFQHRATSRS